MAHEHFQEMMTAHALSALDAAEERELQVHLSGCEKCRDDLDQFRAVAAALSLAAGGTEPSPEVRSRILEQIKQERGAGSHGGPGGSEPSAAGKTVLEFAPRKNVWTSIGSLGAIAASIAVLAMLVGLFVLWRENSAVRTELAQLTSQIQTTEAELARERETVALLTNSGSQLTLLAGTDIARSAQATIAYDPSGRAVLLAKGLPVAPPGKAYQLWFIVGNQKLPGKVFTTDAAGNGKLRDEIPAAAREGAVFAVTLEPAQGVTAPTGQIYLVSGS